MRTTTTKTTRRRRATVIRRRVRCRICGAYEAKRFCPAVNAQICPYCCADMRPNRPDCQTCRYNLFTIATSREVPQPDAKFHAALVSDSESVGMIDLAIAWEKPDGRLKAMFLLLDFWKKGLKECFVDVDISKEEFQQRCTSMGGRGFKKISLDDAKKLIQRGLYISKAVGTSIPWSYQRWQSLLGDMSHVPEPRGSLYKCARCGGELSKPVIEVMKKHAQLEDAHFYMVCEKCAGEFED
jgi:hypothetical protein